MFMVVLIYICACATIKKQAWLWDVGDLLANGWCVGLQSQRSQFKAGLLGVTGLKYYGYPCGGLASHPGGVVYF